MTRALPADDLIDRACDAVLDGSDDAFLDADAFAAELALVAGELTAFAAPAPLSAPLPAALRDRLLTQLDAHFAARGDAHPAPTSAAASTATASGAPTTSGATKTSTTTMTAATSTSKQPASQQARGRGWARSASAAWAFAAAAAVVAVLGWWPKAPPAPQTPPTLSELRTALLARPETTTIAFGATDDVAARGANGDVVWNNATQTGFMRIRGLAKNQATVEQYQLWIFDAARDDRYPVDGGVFDIDGDDVIVAIHAAIDVRKPALFAVTVEKPGGVVVSDRSRIVLTAKVG